MACTRMSAMVATVQDKFDTLAPMMNENLVAALGGM